PYTTLFRSSRSPPPPRSPRPWNAPASPSAGSAPTDPVPVPSARSPDMHRPTPVVAALAAAAAVAAPAAAQEALLTGAPTRPAAGHVVLRVQSRYAEFSDFPADADDASLWVVDTSITLGITGRLSLQANIPVRYEEVDRTAPP